MYVCIDYLLSPLSLFLKNLSIFAIHKYRTDVWARSPLILRAFSGMEEIEEQPRDVLCFWAGKCNKVNNSDNQKQTEKRTAYTYIHTYMLLREKS